MRRLLVFGIGLTLAARNAGTARAQEAPPSQVARPAVADDTLVVGTSTLKLGMAKDDVVQMLSLQYDLTNELPGTVEARASTHELSALVHFDKNGRLDWASKFWTPDTSRHYTDGEIGRAIFALWGTLPSGTGCQFITEQSHFLDSKAPFKPNGGGSRLAHIECGHKRITFSTISLKGEDSLTITEGIDAKSVLDQPR
jgi:hypothetical protein